MYVPGVRGCAGAKCTATRRFAGQDELATLTTSRTWVWKGNAALRCVWWKIKPCPTAITGMPRDLAAFTEGPSPSLTTKSGDQRRRRARSARKRSLNERSMPLPGMQGRRGSAQGTSLNTSQASPAQNNRTSSLSRKPPITA